MRDGLTPLSTQVQMPPESPRTGTLPADFKGKPDRPGTFSDLPASSPGKHGICLRGVNCGGDGSHPS
jgi:hypothetical protein